MTDAPQCKGQDCAEPTRWSVNSRRWLQYCSDECRAPASRGKCGTGRHPHPGFGEKCKLCKRERDNEYTAKRQADRLTQGPPKPKPKPEPVPVQVFPSSPVQVARPVWRPAGIERYAARGGPDCPVA